MTHDFGDASSPTPASTVSRWAVSGHSCGSDIAESNGSVLAGKVSRQLERVSVPVSAQVTHLKLRR
jgi:hypothetical protein